MRITPTTTNTGTSVEAGLAWTVTFAPARTLDPAASVTVTVTRKVPAAEYEWRTDWPPAERFSPKFQRERYGAEPPEGMASNDPATPTSVAEGASSSGADIPTATATPTHAVPFATMSEPTRLPFSLVVQANWRSWASSAVIPVSLAFAPEFSGVEP
jgi:hypothetical protein